MREDDSYAARENVRVHNARTEVTTSFAGMILLHGAKYVNQSQKTAIQNWNLQIKLILIVFLTIPVSPPLIVNNKLQYFSAYPKRLIIMAVMAPAAPKMQ